jgi:hypothetical protein
MSMILDLLIYDLGNSSFAIWKIMTCRLFGKYFDSLTTLLSALNINWRTFYTLMIICGLFSNISISLVQTLYMLMIYICLEFKIWLIIPMLFLNLITIQCPFFPKWPWVILLASMYVCRTFSYTVYFCSMLPKKFCSDAAKMEIHTKIAWKLTPPSSVRHKPTQHPAIASKGDTLSLQGRGGVILKKSLLKSCCPFTFLKFCF